MFLCDDASSMVVTFTYLQGQETNLAEFVRQLEVYLPPLSAPHRVPISLLGRFDSHFEKAKEPFDSMAAIPLGSDASAELLRHFQIRKDWDLARYSSLTEADLISRNQARSRFGGRRFEHLYRGWKVGRVGDVNIRQEFGASSRHATAHIGTEVLFRVAVPEQEPEEKN